MLEDSNMNGECQVYELTEYFLRVASHCADCACMLIQFDLIVRLLHLHVKVFIHATTLIYSVMSI